MLGFFVMSERRKSGWGDGLEWWASDGRAWVSCVFSWLLDEARAQCIALLSRGYQVEVGGPAVALNREVLEDLPVQSGGEADALWYHNKRATVTTRGCIRRCPFCLVHRVEGELVELEHWEPKPIVCDNNLLAASRAHFDRVIDSLKGVKGVDFNSGLDLRLLTKYHADRIAELDVKHVRMSFDHISLESEFHRAYGIWRKAGFTKKQIRVYVLIGYNDTPEDAAYRLGLIMERNLLPFPMRYEPLDARERGKYVGPGWTEAELKRVVRYYMNVDQFGSIPFHEFVG